MEINICKVGTNLLQMVEVWLSVANHRFKAGIPRLEAKGGFKDAKRYR
ncbi:MAG: hypothetical protein GXO19_07175 [Epsilonproteobacteria bacterium]|nr:hypothetical protein [Campylobacterota bacterium]